MTGATASSAPLTSLEFGDAVDAALGLADSTASSWADIDADDSSTQSLQPSTSAKGKAKAADQQETQANVTHTQGHEDDFQLEDESDLADIMQAADWEDEESKLDEDGEATVGNTSDDYKDAGDASDSLEGFFRNRLSGLRADDTADLPADASSNITKMLSQLGVDPLQLPALRQLVLSSNEAWTQDPTSQIKTIFPLANKDPKEVQSVVYLRLTRIAKKDLLKVYDDFVQWHGGALGTLRNRMRDKTKKLERATGPTIWLPYIGVTKFSAFQRFQMGARHSNSDRTLATYVARLPSSIAVTTLFPLSHKPATPQGQKMLALAERVLTLLIPMSTCSNLTLGGSWTPVRASHTTKQERFCERTVPEELKSINVDFRSPGNTPVIALVGAGPTWASAFESLYYPLPPIISGHQTEPRPSWTADLQEIAAGSSGHGSVIVLVSGLATVNALGKLLKQHIAADGKAGQKKTCRVLRGDNLETLLAKDVATEMATRQMSRDNRITSFDVSGQTWIIISHRAPRPLRRQRGFYLAMAMALRLRVLGGNLESARSDAKFQKILNSITASACSEWTNALDLETALSNQDHLQWSTSSLKIPKSFEGKITLVWNPAEQQFRFVQALDSGVVRVVGKPVSPAFLRHATLESGSGSSKPAAYGVLITMLMEQGLATPAEIDALTAARPGYAWDAFGEEVPILDNLTPNDLARLPPLNCSLSNDRLVIKIRINARHEDSFVPVTPGHTDEDFPPQHRDTIQFPRGYLVKATARPPNGKFQGRMEIQNDELCIFDLGSGRLVSAIPLMTIQSRAQEDVPLYYPSSRRLANAVRSAYPHLTLPTTDTRLDWMQFDGSGGPNKVVQYRQLMDQMRVHKEVGKVLLADQANVTKANKMARFHSHPDPTDQLRTPPRITSNDLANTIPLNSTVNTVREITNHIGAGPSLPKAYGSTTNRLTRLEQQDPGFSNRARACHALGSVSRKPMPSINGPLNPLTERKRRYQLLDETDTLSFPPPTKLAGLPPASDAATDTDDTSPPPKKTRKNPSASPRGNEKENGDSDDDPLSELDDDEWDDDDECCSDDDE